MTETNPFEIVNKLITTNGVVIATLKNVDEITVTSNQVSLDYQQQILQNQNKIIGHVLSCVTSSLILSLILPDYHIFH